jgi:hypothetical protein
MDCLIADSYRSLAAAVLTRAAKDIKANNSHADEARWFLGTEWAEVMAEVAKADLPRMRRQFAVRTLKSVA